MFYNKIRPLNSLLFNVSTSLLHTTRENAAVNKVMKKVLTGGKKKKRLYMEDAILPISSSFTKDLFNKPTRENTRRLAVLNKLFMMHITDLMTTGENASRFAGYGLEINRVKVTPDYQGLNVYWIAKDGINDDEITSILQVESGTLRHELTQLHVVGMVPRIQFIKDKEYARIVEVESRLAYADFGEDYEPSDSSVKYKSYLELTKSLDPKLKEKILELEDNCQMEINEDIPDMPQNVLGLNHSEMMERIQKSMRKSQGLHRNQSIEYVHEEGSRNPNPIKFKSVKAQREAFQQFLAARQVLRNKMRKTSKNFRPDLDYLEEQSEIVKRHHLDSIKIDELEDRDYVEEDYEIGIEDDKKIM